MSELTETKPIDFRIGIKDNAGDKVVKIYNKSSEYVIYRTKSTIRIEIDDDVEDGDEYNSKHGDIAVELARIYSWLPNNLSWTEPINRQIARSIHENILGKNDFAKVMLDHAEERIKRLRVINGRLLYAISSFVVASCLIALLIIYRAYLTQLQGFSEYEIYIRLAASGAIGGALSVSLGFNKFDIDIDANWITNCLIGASRIFISVSAALFSYLAIESGLLLSALSSESSPYGVYVVAMVAGFSEMFVPNLMANLAKQHSKESHDVAQKESA